MINLKNLLENNGYETRSYSGRGMYGQTCLGVESDSPRDVIGMVVDILLDVVENQYDVRNDDALNELQELGDVLKTAKQDSMGMGSIIYFPDVPYE